MNVPLRAPGAIGAWGSRRATASRGRICRIVTSRALAASAEVCSQFTPGGSSGNPRRRDTPEGRPSQPAYLLAHLARPTARPSCS